MDLSDMRSTHTTALERLRRQRVAIYLFFGLTVLIAGAGISARFWESLWITAFTVASMLVVMFLVDSTRRDLYDTQTLIFELERELRTPGPNGTWELS